MKRTRSVTAPKKQKFLSYLGLVSLQIPFPQLCWSLPLSGPGSWQPLSDQLTFLFRELGTGLGSKVKPHHIAHCTALPSSSSPQSAENWGDYYLGLMRGSLIPLGRGSPSNDSPKYFLHWKQSKQDHVAESSPVLMAAHRAFQESLVLWQLELWAVLLKGPFYGADRCSNLF